MVNIAIKRVYDEPGKQDGARVLVDKIWPRGIRKNQLAMDAWYKEIAPSTELRKWFHHDPEKWRDFRNRYLGELKQSRELADKLLLEQKHGKLTLLYAARDESHNHALVLREYLEKLDHGQKH